MKLGILECDHIPENLRPRFISYKLVFERLLQPHAQKLTCVSYRVFTGEFPEHPDGCGGYLITGSARSVYESEPWIERLEAYVRTLHQLRKPLIGICFGHQMIAQALGGRTEKAAQGWGVGRQTYQVLETPAWLDSSPPEFSILASHQDQVTELPDGATRLASSGFCKNAAFTLGDHVLSFQGHPEFTKEFSQGILDLRREHYGEELYASGVASLQHPIQAELVASWMMQFLNTQSERTACA
tara:strand:+ start:576 stop:1301 length:726 start_codon:yes stop_codon:yes gene_type:complete